MTDRSRNGESKKSLEEVLLPAIKAHRGDVAIAVKHLKTGESYEYQADQPMPTASLIKFPVMIAAYDAVEKGKLSLDDRIELKKDDKVPGSGMLTSHFSPGTTISLRDAIHLMIVYSDNTATNLVLDKLGLPATNERHGSARLPRDADQFEGVSPRYVDRPRAEHEVRPGQHDGPRHGQAVRIAARAGSW